MIFQPIKVGASVIPHFRVIFTEKFISYFIFMFQGHSQGQKANFKVKNIKNDFFTKKVVKKSNTSFLWDFYRRIDL